MDSRFSQGGFSEEVLWEDIAAKMACLGYDRNGFMCREKWESINNEYLKKSSKLEMSSKKRKENSRGYNNNESSTSLYNHGGYNCDQMNDGTANSSPSPSNANVRSTTHDHSCFPAFLIGEGSENLWENYGLKINKGGQNQ
ncbi:hypothetical protein L484_013804 [Morus notabilis]|uniref:Myb/SANT-like DNA-binding domain-containing protein n=1 Tax=Morus notabilis TaxID=981085 RepID=W9QSZ5_9ROSA|nr:hypothetical protein L484_013804 [Morus notabilis]